MRGTNQGGSLAGFIIVGVLLALALIGGLYGLNRYNAQRAVEDTVAEEKTDTSPVADRQRTNNESDKKTEDKPAEEPAKPAPAPQPASSSSSSTRPQTAATTANLPQTGPADTLMALVAVGALTFATTHFVRSRN